MASNQSNTVVYHLVHIGSMKTKSKKKKYREQCTMLSSIAFDLNIGIESVHFHNGFSSRNICSQQPNLPVLNIG